MLGVVAMQALLWISTVSAVPRKREFACDQHEAVCGHDDDRGYPSVIGIVTGEMLNLRIRTPEHSEALVTCLMREEPLINLR